MRVRDLPLWVVVAVLLITVYENCGQLGDTGLSARLSQTQPSSGQNPQVAPPVILNFTLIDTTTNLPIPAYDPIPMGATISLASLPHTTLSVRANVNPDPLGSVFFTSDLLSPSNTENLTPYSLCADASGIYNDCMIGVGNHTVTATPYPEASLGGAPGVSVTINFTVTN